jgi:translation initiation factor 2-alpha kinase 3
MSMFRKPGEDSSSSSESSNEPTGNEETNESHQSHQDTVLSRIQTLDSGTSTSDRQQPPRLDARQSSTQNVRDLMLHALLEEKAFREAAQKLGKDVSDPDVQKMGREAYHELARQISNNVDDTYAGDDMRKHRATAQEGISKLTRSNLSRLAVVAEGDALSQALVMRPSSPMALSQPPATGFDILSGLHVPAQLHLRGYPGLQTDRYAREFAELEVVGKGGYGRVFKARHRLDGFIYAVKRIPVSPTKFAKIQERGSEELESMLAEVRSLARFDHANVVRYHNAWLEFTTGPLDESITIGPDRFLENPAASPMTVESSNLKLGELSLDDLFDRPDDGYGADIVFEFSDTGAGAEFSKGDLETPSYKAELRRSSRRRNRRSSQASQATVATVATISSTMSRMSAVEDVDEDEEDEDIETIPRSHVPLLHEGTSDVSESMLTHSDAPGHLVAARSNIGPILTLNVQMSLCETNLAAFLAADRSGTTANPASGHCFHPCVSLELLDQIVSGVQYLHSQEVVHRDLKPANIFLSLSTARQPPYGSVDVSSCKGCSSRERLHVTPRIGDFGLVAALDDSCLDIGSATKPVGTEFYRPVVGSRVNEKLDVFALGVIAFEMLQKFGTRMERVSALTEFRRGRFPETFSKELGDHGVEIEQLLGGMVETNEQERLSCDEVRLDIGKLVSSLKS